MNEFVSYAQNFEDVMLWRALKHVEAGFYIDVGAQDPKIDSVSLAFYERGWRGVHIEPTPAYAEEIRQARPGETVIQAALTDKAGVLTFYEFAGTGLSTGDPTIAEAHVAAGYACSQISVPCITLDDLLASYADKPIHWLKIDVEGFERQVIEGWKGSSIKPWVVVVESTRPLSQAATHQEWEPLLLAKGYAFAYSDGVNRYYVSDEHAELKQHFQFGPNLLDGFVLSRTSPYCSALNGEMMNREKCLADATAALERVREHAEWLQGEVAVRDAELEARRQQLEEAGARESELRTQFAEREQALTAQLDETSGRLASTEAAAREVREQLGILQEHAAWLDSVLAARQSELESIYRSRSWRLTAPVRWAGRRARRLVTALKTGLRTASLLPRRIIRGLLKHLVVWLSNRPALRRRLAGLLSRFPGAHAHLKAFIRHRLRPQTAPAPEGGAPVVVPDAYPSSVRVLYHQLLAERSRHAGTSGDERSPS